MTNNKPRPASEVQQKNAEQLVENLGVLDSVCTVLETTREEVSRGNKKKATGRFVQVGSIQNHTRGK
jgi:hypothetical protein